MMRSGTQRALGNDAAPSRAEPADQKFFSTALTDLPRRYWSQSFVKMMYQDTSDMMSRIPMTV